MSVYIYIYIYIYIYMYKHLSLSLFIAPWGPASSSGALVSAVGSKTISSTWRMPTAARLLGAMTACL